MFKEEGKKVKTELQRKQSRCGDGTVFALKCEHEHIVSAGYSVHLVCTVKHESPNITWYAGWIVIIAAILLLIKKIQSVDKNEPFKMSFSHQRY